MLNPLRPIATHAFTHDAAAHLLRRTVIGARPADVDRLVMLGLPAALDSLMKPFEPDHTRVPHLFGSKVISEAWPLDSYRYHEYFAEKTFRYMDGRKWWATTIVDAPCSMQERMALLWHMHFATSFNNAHYTEHGLDQLSLFRKHGLGTIDALLDAVTHSTAMLIYLDSISNRWFDWGEFVNENHARELFELHAMGAYRPDGTAPYTQQDVVAAAHAMSGWRLVERWEEHADGTKTLWRERDLEFRPDHWDFRDKTIFGRTGPWNSRDVIRLLFEERGDDVRRHFARRLYHEFVSDTADDTVIQAIADVLKAHDGNIAATLRVLLSSEIFYHATTTMAIVRSPAHLLLGTLRMLDAGSIPDAGSDLRTESDLVDRLARNGHMLYDPPNVAGWSTGTAWLHSSSVPRRIDTVRRIAEGRLQHRDRSWGEPVATYDAVAFVRQLGVEHDVHALTERLCQFCLGTTDDATVGAVRAAFLQGGTAGEWYVADDDPICDDRLRRGLATLLSAPRYQLM